MKIEIGESLIFSWLRHVLGCPIAQTNWKPSPTWPIRHEASLAADFEKLRETAGQRLGFEVFKKSSFHQFIRQAEIDIFGLRFDGSGSTGIAVDSAFHEAGVNYGKETVSRILKKLIRTAFALEAYFDLHKADIVFATPKMGKDAWDDLQGCWPALQSILGDCASLSANRMNLRIVANDDFVKEIIQPILDRMDDVADTSELFLRAQQLVRLCEVTPRQRRIHQSSAAARPVSDGELKIGEHVRQTIARLADAERLTPLVLEQLTDPLYCRRTFNLGHPFLKSLDSAEPMNSHRFDARGYSRYWCEPVRVGSRTFFVCGQWKEPQRGIFDRWVRDLELVKQLQTAASSDAGSVSAATRVARPIRALTRPQTLK